MINRSRSTREPRPSRRIATDVEARQGPRGRPVVIVLAGSLLLLAVYLVGMLVWGGATSPSDPRGDTTAGIIRDPTSDMRQITPANPAYPVPVVPAIK